jgi:amidophosphoribosyltransferase
MLTAMLITMTDRGPDSAGIAIYNGATEGRSKLVIQSETPDRDFPGLDAKLGAALGDMVTMTVKDTHAVLSLPARMTSAARTALTDINPALRVMSRGDSIEIYKEVGLPRDVAARFALENMSGTRAWPPNPP